MDTLRRILVTFLFMGLGMGLVFPVYAHFFVEWKPGMFWWFAAGCLMAGLMVGVGNFLVARAFLIRPLRTISVQVAEIGEGHLDQRLDAQGTDEIGQIARSVNQMLDAVAHPVVELSHRAQRIARGDLTVDLDVVACGELSALVDSFAEMTRSLREFNGVLQAELHTLAEASTELEATARSGQEQRSASSGALEELEGLAGSLATSSRTTREATEAVRERLTHSLDLARQAAEVASSTNASAEEGARASERASEALHRVSQAGQQTAEAMAALDRETARISEVVSVIRAVADQTNLLSLNATIEAASAGEHGAGFAVVASEVRELSTRSREAADRISELVSGVQGQAHALADQARATQDDLQEGAATVAGALDNLRAIADSATQTIDTVREVESSLTGVELHVDELTSITTSADQGARELRGQAEVLASLFGDTTRAMEQLEHASGGLSQVAERLRDMSERYAV